MKKTAGGVTNLYIGKLYECVGSACSNYVFAGLQRILVDPLKDKAIYYYHPDHLDSSTVVTDKLGAVVQNLTYYPYGKTRTSSGTVKVTHQYTGQALDDSTGLYDYGARYYDPALGRFISADTLVPDPANPQALNRYTYVLNNPLIYIDPSGHSTWNDFWEDTVDFFTEDISEELSAGIGVTLQLFGGPLGSVAGTAILTQTELGRNVMAVEIIVATAIATAYCGGCGATASAALVGELAGGYGAYRNGGDILTGVAIGGLAGASGSYAGSYAYNLAGGGTFSGFLAGGVAGGATSGFVIGAGTTAAYGGSMREIWQAGYQGAAQGAAIGAATAPFAYLFNQVTQSQANWTPPEGAKNTFGIDRPMDGSALDIVKAGSPASNVLNNGPGFASLSHVHDNLMGSLSCCGIAYLVTNVSSVPHAIVMTYGALLNRYPYIPGLVNQAER